MNEAKKYKAQDTYSNIKEKFDNQTADAGNKSDAIGVMLLGSLDKFTPTTVFLLENLTGLDLSSKEKLFDYLKLNVSLTEEQIVQFAAVQLEEALYDKGDKIDELIGKPKNVLS